MDSQSTNNEQVAGDVVMNDTPVDPNQPLSVAELSQFYGTEHYYQWSALFRNMVLTDGAKYVAERASAYWLMDAIASYLPKYQRGGFAVAKFVKRKKDWLLTIDYGNGGKPLARQIIQYTDFPLDEITLYVAPGDGVWVIMLPSEY